MTDPTGIRVLYVDDEPDFVELAADMLEREDSRFSVETATSASEGLDRLTANDFDCVVSDYQMPDQDGIEFLATIRDEYSDLPFILYTGKGSEDVASKAISAGVTEYLQKGSGTSQYAVLANKIAEAVEQYHSRQHLEESEKIRDAKSQWETETVGPTVERFGERKDTFVTDTAGTEVNRLYTPADVDDLDYEDDLGFPGQEPYTRGVYSTMYRGQLWTMRQYAGFGTPAETNERYQYLLDQGQTGLSMAFDLPTQMGYDSTDEMAAGEVGKQGVAIDTLADMETVFDGIPLDDVSTSMTINAPASILLAMYIAVGDQQGVPRSELRGTIQNDILKEYVARNTYIYPPEPSMRIITDIFEFCADETPKFNTISISGYHIREAGSTAAQEVAFTLGNGIEYVSAAIDAGLDVDEFAPQLSFFFNAHNNILEEVAKFRAARRLWASIMDERFDAQNPKSKQLKFHTQTAGSTLTAQQIQNNVVRVGYQALAAVLGGTQSLHTNSYDEALSLPSEESVRTALRTQQILAHESGVGDTIDPLAGSYYVESLTDEIEAKARDLLAEVDERGGMRAAIEDQWVQRQIQDVAYERQREIERGDRVIVGVNEFEVENEEKEIDIQDVDEDDEQRKIEQLEATKQERDDEAVDAALEALRDATRGDDNLMPYIVEAVKVYATIGEIAGVLREEFGEYTPGTSI